MKKEIWFTLNKGLPKSAPTAAMGWREWWNAMDITTLFQGAQTTPVTADGQAVYDMNGKLGIVANSYFRQASSGMRPLYKTGGANGKSYLRFDGGDDHTTNVIPASNFLSAAAKTVIIAGSVDAFVNTDGLLQDESGYFYISLLTSGTKLQTLNWSGGYQQTAGQQITVGAPFVYACWHEGGKIYDQVNGGSASAGVTSGNTDSLGANLDLGQRGGLFPQWRFYSMAVSNAVVSVANRAAVINYFKEQLGI